MTEETKKPKPFKISDEDGKIFIEVFPAEEADDIVTIQAIEKELQSRGIVDFNKETLKGAVTAANGQKILLTTQEKRYASVEVNISDDKLEALVLVHPPVGIDMPEVTVDMIKIALKDNGVIFGIDDEVLNDIVTNKRFEEWIVAARGKPKKDGQDGWIDYKFDVDKNKPKAAEKEDGSVDFHELNLIENVVEDQLLAVKMPAIPGEPGVTVTNEHLEPKPAKEAQLIPGKNTKLSEDGKELYAATNGQVKLIAGKVVVDPVYEIKGNVGSHTGNVSFLGDVIVHGNVEDTFNIKATGDIQISQSVGKCILEADGSIYVRGGVMGKNEAHIKAGRDVQSKFIQEATVEAVGDVIVTEAIMHANVDAGNRIICQGKKGMIVGGTVRATHEVNAKTIGNKMSTKTNVEVGLNPKLRQRLQDLEEVIKKDKDNFFKVKKGVTTLNAMRQKLGGKLPDDKEKMYEQLVTTQNNLMEKLKDVAAQVKELQAQLAVKIDGKVAVSGTVYPGTKISISNIIFYVDREYSFTTFKKVGGEIKAHQYEKPKDKKKETKKE